MAPRWCAHPVLATCLTPAFLICRLRASDPTLRLAKAEDAAAIAALSIEVWLGTYLRHGISRFFADYVLAEFTADNIAAILADPAEHVIVSDNTEGIDGFIRVTRGATAPVAGCSSTEIATFYVQPRHHGKGIGTALLRAALDHAQGTGAQAVWLATNAQNTPAIDFYLRHGFTYVGQTHFRVQDCAYLNNVYAFDCA